VDNRKSVQIWFLKTEPSKNWRTFRWCSDRNCMQSAVQIKRTKNN